MRIKGHYLLFAFTLFLAQLVHILSPPEGLPFGEEDNVTAKLLRLPGETIPPSRKSGVAWIHYVVSKRTSINTGYNQGTPSSSKIKEITLDDPDLFSSPFLYLTGDHPLPPLTPTQIRRLSAYLTAGGFLYIDSAEGINNGPFTQSVRALLEQLFPKEPLTPIPSDHVIYSSFYLLKQGYGRTIVDPTLYGIFDNNRLMVLFNPNDLAGALARDTSGGWLFATNPPNDNAREYARRFAVNLFMYATCLNYKKDQAHIPFIMKRRNWKL